MTNAYLEQQILASDPVELIHLLYQGAVESVVKARAHLAGGDIAGRSAAITKCMNILVELGASLNHAEGGEISLNLGRLYDYMQGRLLDANLKQADGPLAEVLNLLEPLAEAWRGVKLQREAQGLSARVEAPPYAPAWADQYQSAGSGQGSQVWTL